ncbi:multidrug efflux MATE transporter BexA [Niabella terrae]
MPSSQPTSLQVRISTRQILKIALPIALAMLVPQLNFIANTIFLSHLGETELGTAGITGVYYLVFALVGSGLNSGLQALISRRAGENQPREIGRLFMQSLYIALTFSIFIIGMNALIVNSFLAATLASEKVLAEAVSFLHIRVWGLPLLFIFQMGNALLVGSNNSKLLKYGFMAQALVNIFFDYALIFGHFGFPAFGFNGAAYASILAEATGVIIVFSILIRKGFFGRFSIGEFTRPDWRTLRIIFNQSLPLVLQFVLSVSAWLLFYILIEHLGERELAISNTMRNFFAVFGIFTWSFANTTNMMVSNIIGQQQQNQVIRLVKQIARLSFVTVATLCFLLNLFPEHWLGIYGVPADFIREAIPVLRMVSAGLLLMSVAVVWRNSITGTGNTRVNLRIELITILIYSIYIYLVIEILQASLMVAWAAELLYWGATFLLARVYMRGNRWKERNIWT